MRSVMFVTFALLGGCGIVSLTKDAGSGDAGSDGADGEAGTPTADATTPTADASDGATAPITCALLGSECGANHACYPYPFDSERPTGTMCGLQGTGTAQVFCASQLDCDAQSLCSDPGQPDSICLMRCDLAFSLCAVGEHCARLPAYPGVGVCISN